MNNEETIYQDGNVQQNNVNSNVEGKGFIARSWKPVTIGGAIGILMGGGALLTAQEVMAGETDDASAVQDAPVATVSDDMSFAEAFAAARAQVGAGGVFQWHGAVFNTYTVEEWNAMSEAEHQQFAHQVHTEVDASHVDTQHIASNTHHHVADHGVDNHQDVAQHTDGDHGQAHNISGEAQQPDPDLRGFEVEGVRIIGYGEVDGHTVVGYDVNSDNDPDVAIIDVDGSGGISNPDVIMDSEGNMATIEEIQQAHDEQYPGEPDIYAQNPDVADDGMPDYMNDAIDV